MPQAIKHYTGSVNNTISVSNYTLPASTISIVLPSITITGSSSNGVITIGWNSSTSVASSTGNLAFTGIDSDAPYIISHTSKYDVQVPVRYSQDSLTYYSAAHTAGVTSGGIYSWRGIQSTSTPHVKESAYGTWIQARQQSTSGGDNYIALHDFRTGAWVMSAGHKLGIYANNAAYAKYNFLVLEEAAS